MKFWKGKERKWQATLFTPLPPASCISACMIMYHFSEILLFDLFLYIIIVSKHTKPGGHAVVLMRCDPHCLTFMNSWGQNFADGGFFRVKDQAVLNETKFYDVYWTENDLKENEKEAYKRKCAERAKQLSDTFPSTKELPYECPKCHNKSKVKEYLGHVLEAQCPTCHEKFVPTNEAILQSLYSNSFEL